MIIKYELLSRQPAMTNTLNNIYVRLIMNQLAPNWLAARPQIGHDSWNEYLWTNWLQLKDRIN